MLHLPLLYTDMIDMIFGPSMQSSKPPESSTLFVSRRPNAVYQNITPQKFWERKNKKKRKKNDPRSYEACGWFRPSFLFGRNLV